MKPVIEVKQLGKRFRINDSLLREPRQRSFCESVTNTVIARFRRIQSPHATINWQDFWALRDVSFSVNQGEVVGIIGLNGAGKSTLLKILTRICEPSEGEVRLRGRVGSLLEVGTGFHPELTGRENVFLNGSILGMTQQEIRSQFDEIVKFSGIGRFLDTPVKRYSSGMRVRLAFSVAANLNPEILIIDEVLAVGDAPFRAKCIEKMRSLAKSGRTVLFVSHNTGAIQQLCSRVILLEDGRIKLIGNSGEVIRAYLNKDGTPSSSSPGEVASRPEKPPALGEKVQITTCTIHNSQGLSSSKIKFGEEFSLELGLRGKAHLSQLSVVVAIHTENNTCVASSGSGLQGNEFEASPDSHTRITSSFGSLPLAPGKYSICVEVRGKTDIQGDSLSDSRLLDSSKECLWFEVSDTVSEGFSLFENHRGNLIPQPSWKIQEVETTSEKSEIPHAA